ncbi:hypothetical protein GH714_019845 [Hevea brasiliensis]|uniref:Uncharacterized protein n=1 Tax=Hevea brasiliensis TaxID=3981 RepID=A0A6A6LLC0_HEVBR|nr:hypothetical protein GH714_019845 [Hevea brasiliensis]
MAANAYEKVAKIMGKVEQKIEKASVDWSSIIQQEIAKYMQNQNLAVNEASYVNFTGFTEWFTELKQKKGKGKGNMAANAYEKVAEIEGKAEQKIEKASVDWSSIIQ